MAALGGAVLFIAPCSVIMIQRARTHVIRTSGAEARANLPHIARLAAAAIDRDGRPCPSATKPVPADFALVTGKKFQSRAEDWNVDAPQKAGFACIGFSIPTPQQYQYDYRSAGDEFTITATGDVDGNGKKSTFAISGRIVAGKGTYLPDIRETDSME